jgi:DNA repair exonuclease SbcCD nuclease subunit
MSRILAFGDSQLGVATVDLADQRDVLDRIVQVALERQVDTVLHGGDVFEGPVVTPAQLRTFVDATRPLRDAGIPLLVIRGNGRHDMAVRDVHALDILREVDGITVSDTPAVSVLANKVAVCTLPWVHPGRLIANANGSLTHDEASLNTSDMLVRIAQHLRERVVGLADLPKVLLAHWAISGSALPTGLNVNDLREPVLPWADLDAIGYDAIIGAHIHQPQTLSNPELDQTLGIVVGSPQQLNHGETGEHGCWILDLGADGYYAPPAFPPSAEFVPIESKRFVTYDFDAAELLNGEMFWPNSEGDIVRVRYQATEDEARRIDHDRLRQSALACGIHSFKIEPTIIRKDRARAQQISEQLSPIDALAAYCDANDVDPDRALAMLARLKEWSE